MNSVCAIKKNKKQKPYMLLVLQLELDFPPLTGILLTMTEEPLGMRPSSSVYSEKERRENAIKEFIRISENQIKIIFDHVTSSHVQGF